MASAIIAQRSILHCCHVLTMNKAVPSRPWNLLWRDLQTEIATVTPALFAANRWLFSASCQGPLSNPTNDGTETFTCELKFPTARGSKGIALIAKNIPNEAFEIRILSLARSASYLIYRGSDIVAALKATHDEVTVTVDLLKYSHSKRKRNAP